MASSFFFFFFFTYKRCRCTSSSCLIIPPTLLLLLLPLLTTPSSSPSVYDILPKYGLPSGLLPDSVTNYTLADDGSFQVTLQKPCYIEFQYLVYYDKLISGKLNLGSITDLQGIQVQRFFFLWLDVDEIRVDLPPSDSIYFKVGIINKELDVHQFSTVRSCKDNLNNHRLPTTTMMPTPLKDFILAE